MRRMYLANEDGTASAEKLHDDQYEVIVLTPSELESLERKAFEAAREEIPATPTILSNGLKGEIVHGERYETFDDYKKSEEK